MVGFPGESVEEFADSYAFCQSAGFAAIHVFPYSPRPGTRAARMTNAIEGTEKKRRVALMLDLARASKERCHSRFLGQSLDVLWEGSREDVWFGLTDNYMRVLTSSPVALTNRLLAANLVGHVEGALWGELAIEKDESLPSRGIEL
jgi:threonylcarbamoyladenosine tRNA methylthiotransferase MtaB